MSCELARLLFFLLLLALALSFRTRRKGTRWMFLAFVAAELLACTAR